MHPRRAFPRFAALLAAAFAVTLATSSASAQSVSFVAILAGVNELPSNASPATGVARAVLNTTTRELSINGEFSGLLSNAVTVLIHQAPPGVNGPVQFRLGHTGTMSGSITGPLNPGPMVLTEAQQAQLLEGNWYVNVHTIEFPYQLPSSNCASGCNARAAAVGATAHVPGGDALSRTPRAGPPWRRRGP